MRAGHLQGRNRARADSAVPGPSAGPPPLGAVISLLEVGWDWNPSAQAEAIISPAEEEERPLQQSGPGSRCTSRQRKGRSRHGHVLTKPRCCLWPEQRGTTKPSLSFPNHNGKAAAKMTPQISASISAASIRELLFLDTLQTTGTPAPRRPQLGQPTCLGVNETASAIPLLPLPSGRGSVTELKSSRGIILGLKLFLFIYSSRRTRITLSLRARVTRHSSGHKALCLAGSSWQESQGQSLLLTLYCQQRVPVAAGNGGHQVWMCLLQLHWPGHSCFLILPAQASPGSFSPRAHLTICRGI